MRSGPTTSHGVMEGNGAYNKHAKLQAGGAALALPLLENAVRKMTLDLGDFPIVIADYGSSQGKNSLAPMRVAISALRTRLGPNRPILVSHVDLPSNDFNTLFQVLDSDPDTYVLDEPNVVPCAIGRSFYGKVFPPHHVHLGWSSYAAVWPQPHPDADPRPFLRAQELREHTRGVRSPERPGLGGFPVVASPRAPGRRPPGRRAPYPA